MGEQQHNFGIPGPYCNLLALGRVWRAKEGFTLAVMIPRTLSPPALMSCIQPFQDVEEESARATSHPRSPPSTLRNTINNRATKALTETDRTSVTCATKQKRPRLHLGHIYHRQRLFTCHHLLIRSLVAPHSFLPSSPPFHSVPQYQFLLTPLTTSLDESLYNYDC